MDNSFHWERWARCYRLLHHHSSRRNRREWRVDVRPVASSPAPAFPPYILFKFLRDHRTELCCVMSNTRKDVTSGRHGRDIPKIKDERASQPNLLSLIHTHVDKMKMYSLLSVFLCTPGESLIIFSHRRMCVYFQILLLHPLLIIWLLLFTSLPSDDRQIIWSYLYFAIFVFIESLQLKKKIWIKNGGGRSCVTMFPVYLQGSVCTGHFFFKFLNNFYLLNFFFGMKFSHLFL